MSILEKIIAVKRQEIVELKKNGLEAVRARFAGVERGTRRSLLRALSANEAKPGIIAEIKKASPSAGVLREDFVPVELAGDYQKAGAAAISIVTDEPFFQGSLNWLPQVRMLVDLPVLRKEFIVDPIQIEESRIAGADAILLIASVLSEAELAQFQARAAELDLECLVEVRDLADAAKVSAAGAPLVGINNRNLADFSIDLQRSIDLLEQLPPTSLIVSESGIEKAADIKKLQAAGINAFLIGSSLVKAGKNRQKLLKELLQ